MLARAKYLPLVPVQGFLSWSCTTKGVSSRETWAGAWWYLARASCHTGGPSDWTCPALSWISQIKASIAVPQATPSTPRFRVPSSLAHVSWIRYCAYTLKCHNLGWLLQSKTASWPAACPWHCRCPLITCHRSNEELPSTPGLSEASSSKAAYPGERGRVDGGEAGTEVVPQVLLSSVAASPQGVGRDEKLAAGTRPACTSSHKV